MNDIQIGINGVPYFQGLPIVSVDRANWLHVVIRVASIIDTVDIRLYRVAPTQGVDGKYEALSQDIYTTDIISHSISNRTINMVCSLYMIPGIDAGQVYGNKVILHSGINRYEADMIYKIL